MLKMEAIYLPRNFGIRLQVGMALQPKNQQISVAEGQRNY